MRKFFKFIFLIAILTVVFGAIYATGQQVLRQSANDPQIQMAEDAAGGLLSGDVPADFMPADRGQFDMSQSLSPFVMIFDQNKMLLETSANLGGVAVVPSAGTFDYAKIHGEDRFTWQPKNGVRDAAVLVYYGGARPGFVLVARSLREVEIREGNLLLLSAFGWAVSIILIFVYHLIKKWTLS